MGRRLEDLKAKGLVNEVVTKVQKGAKLLVLNEAKKGNETSYKVRLEDGWEGWVASSLVSAQP